MDDINLRKSHHNRLKAFLKKVNDHQTSPLSFGEVKEVSVRAEEIWIKYEVVQSRLISTAIDDAAFDLQEREGFKVEDVFMQLRCKIRPLMELLQPAATATPGSSTPAANIRLPPMELPTFNGNIADWTSFKDLFKAAIDKNMMLRGAQKLQYLKAALQGEPATLIKSLTTTDCNYSVAWKQLNERYENEREIVQALVNKLLNCRELKGESATDLQRLVDNFTEVIRALEVLKRPTDQWDDFLVVLLLNKLDSSTRREWAIKQTGTKLPKFSELVTFLRAHVRGLQAAGAVVLSNPDKRKGPVKVHMASTERSLCLICSGNHAQFQCPEFKRKSVDERKKLVMQHRLCFNCLGKDHMTKVCSWKGTCRKCNQRHHSLLHWDSTPRSSSEIGNGERSVDQRKMAESSHRVSSCQVNVDYKGLLMTAVVHALDKYGSLQPVRVFIDGGAQAEFISEECVSRLGLKRHYTSMNVSGFCGAKVGKAKGAVETTLQSRYNSEYSIEFTMLVLPTLGDDMPNYKCKSGGWEHLRGLELADPCWHKPGPIDMVVGSQYLHKVLLNGRRVVDDNSPVGWESIFGWVVSGRHVPEERNISSFQISVDNTDAILRRFWEVEELPSVKELSKEEEQCQQHFKETHIRDKNGRFIVGVPFTEKKTQLGRSRDAAVKRLLQVERKLQRNPTYKQQYTDFMVEYENLGHMIKVPYNEPREVVGKTAHLPHHGVVNESSSTTKMRVVFDGSASSSSGLSLNDVMLVGPTLQDDLYCLLLKFRMFPIVLKADIAKMFRQFKLRDEDADYHRIVWRDSPTKPISDYRLMTVTYGTACAPYLATRCLQQVAFDCSESYPAAAEVLLNNTYVDDVLAGESSKEKAIILYKQLTDAVGTAGLELRKWCSNDPDVLAEIPDCHRETEPLSFDDDQTVKALGVQWHPSNDVFKFKGIEFKYDEKITKRKLLSDAARVFDPLGLISCVSVRAKMMLQEVWKLECGWDDVVPENIERQFMEYKEDLKLLTNLSIPRRITVNVATYEIHGFSDSSEKALGVNLYLRCFFPNGSIRVNFVTSKTKVAPVKVISLPRLELEAAVMLAKLAKRVIQCLKLEGQVFLWSDSTITLTWIAGSPQKWKTFVSNRVSKIQRLTEESSWRHVPGVHNPADISSRGAAAADLIDNDFWWRGPSWLSEPGIPTFNSNKEVNGDLEERASHVSVNLVKATCDIIERFSSLIRLQRVSAYLLRYVRNLRSKVQQQPSKYSGPLSAVEMQEALNVWIRDIQQYHFWEEINSLTKNKKLSSTSKLIKLNPFVDKSGILRVAGRLQNAKIPESHKQQVILPADCHLTLLLVQHAHLALLHGGFQVTWAKLQSEYWILRGRDKVRHFVRSCVSCRRYRAKAAEQMMGNLPNPRVEPARPFLHSGVDYAGPFLLKNPVGRAPKTYKGYMCLFICMATKAVHLEPVSCLSTEGFLEALRRFVSRRGLCAHMYSDCGTNFVGADRELREVMEKTEVNNAIADDLSSRGIQWHFNPPSAPHHGGLWEAGVKSAKHHLRRVVGNNLLTYEQFHTVLCQVEAVLNSRPLYAASADPEDFQALTPGHFLIGEPLMTVPSINLENAATNRLTQFQRQQQRLQHFWRRWNAEYLNTLQQRNKWMWKSENVKQDDLVLIVEECSPGTWKMGRVEKVDPGPDGLVRVVTLRTVSGLVKRPITKLVPLINSDKI